MILQWRVFKTIFFQNYFAVSESKVPVHKLLGSKRKARKWLAPQKRFKNWEPGVLTFSIGLSAVEEHSPRALRDAGGSEASFLQILYRLAIPLSHFISSPT
jgi:hypothetical protein